MTKHKDVEEEVKPEEEVPAAKNAAPDFDFAANATKLNRAKAWVSLNMEVLGNPSGEALTKAIRTRYEALGGKVI